MDIENNTDGQHYPLEFRRTNKLTVTAHGDECAGYRGVLHHVRRFAVVFQPGHAPLKPVSRVYVF